MNVLVYDPFIPESRARDLGVRLTDLQTVLTQSDVVTVHVPLPRRRRISSPRASWRC
jgi:D-3-phosphoglycerate dehydrogenase